MFNKSNYQSPECTVVDVRTEGVLCASSGEIQTPNTETFDPIKDFEW